MFKFLITVLLALLGNSTWATSTSVVEEQLYQGFQANILEKAHFIAPLSPFEQSLFVDALWDLAEEEHPSANEALEEIDPHLFALEERLRLAILSHRQGLTLPQGLQEELLFTLTSGEVTERLAYLLAAHGTELEEAGLMEVSAFARQLGAFKKITLGGAVSTPLLKDLIHHRPARQGVALYMLCRQDRLYPCLMLMRDKRGELLLDEDDKIWTHPSLAASAKGLPSHVRTGNTPAGVWLINSVMPKADSPLFFGKYRRLIIDLVPKSQDEKRLKSLLPKSSQDADWWMPSVVARDIGRNLFRIHGTGRLNTDPSSTYWPFVRTSGCIAQRENDYDGKSFKDQRLLLDSMMRAMELPVSFENETQLRGVLYVIEIDGKKAPVALSDLKDRGIL